MTGGGKEGLLHGTGGENDLEKNAVGRHSVRPCDTQRRRIPREPAAAAVAAAVRPRPAADPDGPRRELSVAAACEKVRKDTKSPVTEVGE